MTAGACHLRDRRMFNRLGVNLLLQTGVTFDTQLPGLGPQNVFIVSSMRAMAVQTFPGSEWFVFNYLVTVFQEILMTLKTKFRITTIFLEQTFFLCLVRLMAFTAQSLGKGGMQT